MDNNKKMKMNFERINVEIERINFELEQNISCRNDFLVKYNQLWDEIKKSHSNRSDDMRAISRKIGEFTYNIDNIISELNKYLKSHRAFNLAIAYLDKEIERCENLISYTEFVVSGVHDGKWDLIRSTGEIHTDCSGLESYIEKKKYRLNLLLERKEKLKNRTTDIGKNTFDIKPNNIFDSMVKYIKIRLNNLNTQSKSGYHSKKGYNVPNYNTGLYSTDNKKGNKTNSINNRENLINFGSFFDQWKEQKNKNIQNNENKPKKQIDIITDFSKYHKTFSSEPYLRSTIQRDFRETKQMNSQFIQCFWSNSNIFKFIEIDRKLVCTSVINTNFMDECFNVLNFESGGNTIIFGDKDTINFEANDFLNRFVCNNMIKVLENSPLGDVHLHVLDSFSSSIFDYFDKAFSTNQNFKHCFSTYNSFSNLLSALNNKCNDITNNFSFNNVYCDETIKSNDFVVIRNLSIADCSSNVLESLFNIIEPSSKYYKCGIRVLVCLDKNKFAYSDEMVNLLFDKICSSAQYYYLKNKMDMFSPVKFDGESFNLVENIPIEGDDYEKLILYKLANLASILKAKHQYISSFKVLHQNDNIIPYSKVISIPFSLNNNNVETIDFDCGGGGNIGLMVLGSSGYGKTEFFKSIILNGAMKYTPDDLNFWLLDFKADSAASIFKTNHIPHIKLMANKSTANDALQILKILTVELENRGLMINSLNRTINKNLSDIVEYNQVVDTNPIIQKQFKHLPRIILLIDEVQEMFRETDSSDLNPLYKEISEMLSILTSKGRYVGIHIGVFGQNLDSGNSSALINNFANQSICKVVFNLKETSIRNAEFGNEFLNRTNEIQTLPKGCIYISKNNNLIKLSVLYDPNLMANIADIRNKYSQYKDEILIIGNEERLSLKDSVAREVNTSYFDLVMSPEYSEDYIKFVIGEDGYKLTKYQCEFTTKQNSTMFLLGSSESIRSSILCSLMFGIEKLNIESYVISKIDNNDPFNKMLLNNNLNRKVFDLKSYKTPVDIVYQEYDRRLNDNNQNQKPIFLVINSIKLISQYFSREVSINENVFCLNNSLTTSDKIEKLISFGSTYNIFVVIACEDEKSDFNIYNNLISNNIFIFNDFNFPNMATCISSVSSSQIRNDLGKVKQNNGFISSFTDQYCNTDGIKEDNESIAFKCDGSSLYKFRPIIFDNADIFYKINKK